MVSWAGITNLILGGWLIASPYLVAFNRREVMWNNIVVGAAVAVLAIVRLIVRSHSGGASWINALLGLWLMVAPFALHYELPTQMWNSVIVGLVVALLALGSVSESRSHHPPTATA
jgi:hypothetical protein